jgi:Ala-tRNA(Pro) deacylase
VRTHRMLAACVVCVHGEPHRATCPTPGASAKINALGRCVSDEYCGTMPATDRLQLKEYLRAHGVRFDVIEHTRSESAPAEAKAVHMPAEQTAKTVVLQTPSGYRFAIISASDRLDLHKAAAALGVSRHDLRFATEADMAAEFPAYEVGAIPPIGPDTPAGLIDLRLLDYQRVVCPAGDHEHSLLVDPLDIVRITGAQTQDLRLE